jgi:hypothetical protein
MENKSDTKEEFEKFIKNLSEKERETLIKCLTLFIESEKGGK